MATVTIIGDTELGGLPLTAWGTPIVYPLTFRHKSLPNGSMTMPGAPLVRPTMRKKVVQTSVVDGGLVTEIIGTDAQRVDIRIIDDAPKSGEVMYAAVEHKPNETLLRDLAQLLAINDTIEVENEYLAQLGITHVVIEEMEPDVQPGRPRVIMNLRCLVDTPYNQLTD